MSEQYAGDKIAAQNKEQVNADPTVQHHRIEPVRASVRVPDPCAMAMSRKDESDGGKPQQIEPWILGTATLEAQVGADACTQRMAGPEHVCHAPSGCDGIGAGPGFPDQSVHDVMMEVDDLVEDNSGGNTRKEQPIYCV